MAATYSLDNIILSGGRDGDIDLGDLQFRPALRQAVEVARAREVDVGAWGQLGAELSEVG